MNLNPYDTSGVTPLKRPARHPAYPGLDHPESSNEAPSSLPDGAIDACSLVCLSCHDGINAPETRIKTVGEWDTPYDFDKHCHPLGVIYDSAGTGKTALKPVALLPPEIILPEGKVGCESCHNLHSSNPYFLNFNRADGLCLRCHIK